MLFCKMKRIERALARKEVNTIKIIEAMDGVDKLLYNTYTAGQKAAWLSKLDAMVWEQILKPREGGETVPFPGYTGDTDRDTVLLVPSPYDSLYLRWLEAQIHYHNGEIPRYNNAITLFNTEYNAYAAACTRAHPPAGGSKRFLF